MTGLISTTGTQGVGKTTEAMRIAREQKLFNPNASVRLLCDLEADCPFLINKATTEAAQKWMFANQIKQELFALSRFDIVVTDRTLIDIIAYTFVAEFQELAMGMLCFAEQHVAHYDEIHFRQICNNPYCFDDGIRDAEDDKFRRLVELTLKDLYTQLEAEGYIKGKVHYD